MSNAATPTRMIRIDANLWTDRNGSTYHVVRVAVDGQPEWTSPITYGYGTQYDQTADDYLTELSLGKTRKELQRDGWTFETGHQRVSRKRDL